MTARPDEKCQRICQQKSVKPRGKVSSGKRRLSLINTQKPLILLNEMSANALILNV